MSLYSLALFIHLLGLIAVFGAFVLLQNAGRRLRGVTTWQEARPWLDLLRSINGMVAGGLIMMLGTGLYMSHELWSFTTPWVMVGIIAAALLMIGEPLVVGRKIAELRRAAEENQGVIPADRRAVITGSPLWSTIHAMNGAALGMVWVMSAKPGWTQSIAVPLALAVLGAMVGVWAPRARHEPTRGTEEGLSPPLARGHRAR